MIQALTQIIFSPRRAWKHLSESTTLQQYILPLLVYPIMILAALSAFVPYWYGFIPLDIATKQATLTLLKYCGTLICSWGILVLLSRIYFMSDCSKNELHLFAGYTLVITLISVIICNILPSSFTFVQFMPAYTVWIVYQGRNFLRIPQENIFSFTVTTSTILMVLPFAWDLLLNKIAQ